MLTPLNITTYWNRLFTLGRWNRLFKLSLLLVFVTLLEAGAHAQTLGQFTFNNKQFGDTLSENDGGAFRNGNWLNVVNSNPGTPGALTGAHFNTGIANIGLSGTSPVYTIGYNTPIANGLGNDLGIVSARFSTNDTFQLAVSTDGVNFTGFVNFGPSLAVSTGVGRTYFYNGGGPFSSTLFVTPVDLSVFGIAAGASISAVRISGSPEADLIRVAGFSTCASAGNDTDGDALCDNWEEQGLTVEVNGAQVFVDLPAMGANKNHKDIFVQADFMSNPGLCLPLIGCFFGHTHQPKPEAIAIVTAAFANAPVTNPDGNPGITLHVDCGPNCVMNPATNQKWGSLSQSHKLAHVDSLGSSSGSNYNWTDFDALKQVNFSAARAPVFHYMIFAHNLGGLDGTSGISRGITASDFIVSLGSWDSQVGTILQQAGTFMHELGHNLSLMHGGNNSVNFKPNYLSVMNYLFQTNGLIVNGAQGTFDYSSVALPSLNENGLNESIGLNGAANKGTLYFCQGAGGASFVANANGPIDWNCNGANNDANVATDINKDTIRTTLTSFNDWANIVFNGGAIGQLGQAVTLPSTTLADDEVTPLIDSQIPKPLKVSVASPGITERGIGESVDLPFTISNGGTQADVYLLSVSSTVPWADLTGLPSSIALAAGASGQVTIHVTVPSGTAVGAEGVFTIVATSSLAPNIKDSGEAVVTAITPLCTAPTITALSADPNTLWPVNHKLVPVTLSSSTSGGCGAVVCKIVSVSSNEPVGPAGDWSITGDLTLDLRSERLGSEKSRTYTITVECTDSSGNSSTKTVTVTVPHDQRK